MQALAQHRPLMSDGPSFQKHTQSRLPQHLTQSQLPQRLKKKSLTRKLNTPHRRRVCTWFGGPVRHSIIKPDFLWKGLILFVSNRKNSERCYIRSEFANRSPPQLAVRHESSRY
jgi:hypothetical protein